MRKSFTLALMLLMLAIFGNAQTLVRGDMNGDGKLNISDVTSSVNTILGKQSQKEISIEELLEDLNLTFKTKDGSIVKVEGKQLMSYSPSHEYVDLGLSSGTLWATTNVGADNPEDYGDHFEWGETKGYKSGKYRFHWETYKYCKGSINSMTKYCSISNFGYNGFVDNLTKLQYEDDAAHINWGSNWRMPTYDEFNELKDECTWTRTTKNGMKGYLVTGPNGNSIFFSLPGLRWDGDIGYVGSAGYYWTSELVESYPNRAYSIVVGTNTPVWYEHGYRGNGQSIRPVRKNKATVLEPVKVASITLSETSIVIAPNASKRINATFTPYYANDTSVSWTSSDESIVSVSNGLIVAFAEGTATITCYANDGSGISASCLVKVDNDCHAYVDLGLTSGTLWATMNIGAESPENYGDFFAWGETEGYNSGKLNFDLETYKFYNGTEDNRLTKYCDDADAGYDGYIDNLTELEPEDDAAYVNWGSAWRIPTLEQMTELRTECTWTWITQNRVKGCLVTGPNRNSIFLPATGYRFGKDHYDYAKSGCYWSSTLKSSTLNSSSSYQACLLKFLEENGRCESYRRDRGQTIRPVRAK